MPLWTQHRQHVGVGVRERRDEQPGVAPATLGPGGLDVPLRQSLPCLRSFSAGLQWLAAHEPPSRPEPPISILKLESKVVVMRSRLSRQIRRTLAVSCSNRSVDVRLPSAAAAGHPMLQPALVRGRLQNLLRIVGLAV